MEVSALISASNAWNPKEQFALLSTRMISLAAEFSQASTSRREFWFAKTQTLSKLRLPNALLVFAKDGTALVGHLGQA